jgi:hypothetical protein
LGYYLAGQLEKRRRWKRRLEAPASGSKASNSSSRLVNVKDFALFAFLSDNGPGLRAVSVIERAEPQTGSMLNR